MIQFEAVHKVYPGGNEGLRNINLHIEAGEFWFLTGHSGAGKSTLLRLIVLLERTSRGRITVAGRSLEHMPAAQIPYYRRHIGMVFQEHRLLPGRRVFDNVALPLHVAGIRYGEIRKRVHAALDKVGLLHKEKVVVESLSAGEKQRVGIARAVVNRPAMLLADEPTGNLDRALSHEILGLFSQFNQVGVTVVIATHDTELCALERRCIAELRQGGLVATHDRLP